MKRELAAAAVLVLLIGISVWNIRKIENLTGDIEIALCKSRAASEELDFRKAREHIADAIALWLEAERYTHSFISHSQISGASQALYELQQTVAEEDIIACSPCYDKLKYILRSIRDTERPSLGSIF